jgi:hypothetical protein
MKKISTLFKKNPNDLSRVINELNPENEWVLTHGRPTRKYDGTACAIIEGELYKRYDVKKGKQVPEGAIPCQDPDAISGHWPHWVKCDPQNKADQFFFEGLLNWNMKYDIPDGTYELCGPKVQGNPEMLKNHELIPHGSDLYLTDFSFEGLKLYLENMNIEGIVFHEIGGEKMCKIRKSDFGIKRL